GEEILVAGGKDGERRPTRQLVDDLPDRAVTAGGDHTAAPRHRRAVGENRRALTWLPHDARRLAELGQRPRERVHAAAIVRGAAVGIRDDDDHRRREHNDYASP